MTRYYCPAGLFGAGVMGDAGLVGAGVIVGDGVVDAGGAICVAGGRVSLDAVLVPFCPG
ncbi:MAG TPA: hypothetical protein VF866_00475 [Xanthobacteraceae bacterium]